MRMRTTVMALVCVTGRQALGPLGVPHTHTVTQSQSLPAPSRPCRRGAGACSAAAHRWQKKRQSQRSMGKAIVGSFPRPGLLPALCRPHLASLYIYPGFDVIMFICFVTLAVFESLAAFVCDATHLFFFYFLPSFVVDFVFRLRKLVSIE